MYLMKAMRKFAQFDTVPVVLAGFMALKAGGATANAQAPASAAPTPAQVTFAKDVAPILQNKCQSCHRTGAISRRCL